MQSCLRQTRETSMGFSPHREKRRGENRTCRPILTLRQAYFQSAKTHERPLQLVRAYSDFAISSNAMPFEIFLALLPIGIKCRYLYLLKI